MTPAATESPDIVLSFAQTEAQMPAWANIPWTIVREAAGPSWRLVLSTAPTGSDATLRLHSRRDDDEITIYYGRDAAQIVIAWRSLQAETKRFWQELSGWILGSALGFAMCVRGMTTLHGSVVAVAGRAVGLLGVSGAGKSTLAAAFLAANFGVMADDHLVVNRDVRGFCALPGPPRLRLWSSSLPVIEDKRESFTQWTDVEGKHHVTSSSATYCAAPLPLAAVYVLAPRDPARAEVTIEKLSPAAALNALMNQRFCTTPLSPTYVAGTMAALSAFAQQTPVHLLYRPQGLETLPAVVDAICRDVTGHAC